MAEEGGRFPLTGRGDVNTYALFAELFAAWQACGRAGVIVPTGIATDATTAPFFASLIEEHRLAALYSFENEELVFPAVHHAMKFCLLTVKGADDVRQPDFVFFARSVSALAEVQRRFMLSAADIARINPNTRTAPMLRARADAELVATIYARVPVLIDEAKGAEIHGVYHFIPAYGTWQRTCSGSVPLSNLVIYNFNSRTANGHAAMSNICHFMKRK